MAERIVFATFSTWVTPTVMINKGEPWDASDPVVMSHPDWFSDVPPDVRSSGIPAEPWLDATAEPTGQVESTTRAVETATAAPGEVRTVPAKVQPK